MLGLWITLLFSMLLLVSLNIYNAQEEVAANLKSRLLESIMNNDVGGIRIALENGENIDLTNDNGWTGAMFAVAFNNLRVLQELIDLGDHQQSMYPVQSLWSIAIDVQVVSLFSTAIIM